MKIKTPIVTLLVGLVIAAITLLLSVRAHSSTNGPYGAPLHRVVSR
jgi:hypothetical protein